MPSFVHETAIQLLEKDHSVTRELCSWVGLPQPGPDPDALRPEIRVDLGILRDVRQMRPDLFVRDWLNRLKELLLALWIIEVQVSKDETRSAAWVLYLVCATLFFKVKPSFLIIAVGRAMERWCTRQVEQDEWLSVAKNVRVIGPSTLAGRNTANPRLAAIVALIYGDEASQELVERTLRGLKASGKPEDADYIRMVLAAIPEELGRKVIEDMQPEYEIGEIELKGYLYNRAFDEGRAEALAFAVLTILRNRGVEPSDGLKAALADCHDVDRLERIVTRATEVERSDDLILELTSFDG